ncbi:MAG TPA: adenylosuccinate synthetase, partial [Polyangiaceae bacterium]|nr:adenylosuccinate synthetase [Polyangiaceae bacterium]
YQLPEGTSRDLPIARIGEAKPIYRSIPGWKDEIEAVRSLDDLPARAQELVRLIETETGVPAFVVSVGPRRDQTIVLRGAFSD